MTWRRFLLLLLPASVFGIGCLAEVLAWALEGTPPRRHDLDRLVVALERARIDAPIVLLGDSVTQDVAKTYRLAAPEVLANLTTNQASGMIGASLLLRRYLAHNSPPHVVLIAATPEFHSYQPAGAAARTYVTSVFRRPEERKILLQASIIATESWRPAAMQIEQKLADPMSGLLARQPTAIPAGNTDPHGGPDPEAGPVLAGVQPQLEARAKVVTALSSSARLAWEDLCRSSRQHRFKIRVMRAPVPASVSQVRGAGWEQPLARDILQICPEIEMGDFNIGTDFPDHAFRDDNHLRRPGWTAQYARLLVEEIKALYRR